MSIQSALAGGRRAAEARMTSRATVKHQSGTTTNPDGFDVPAWLVDYTDHPCRLAASAVVPSRTVAPGSAQVEAATPALHFPHDTRLSDGAVVELTAGEWAGRFFRVTESTGQDQSTALRVRVEEIDEPEGWA